MFTLFNTSEKRYLPWDSFFATRLEAGRSGPGRAYLHELMRAIGGGLDYFDFTVGDESYTREWSNVELRFYDHSAAATMRGLPVAAMTAAYNPNKWWARSLASARALSPPYGLRTRHLL